MNKYAVILGLAVIGTIAAFVVFQPASKTTFLADNNISTLFDEWKVKYNKTFGGAENAYRLQVFGENYNIVQAHNAGNFTYTLALNQFADLTRQEFASIYLGLRTNPMRNMTAVADEPTSSNPSSVNWVEKGAVTAVKNQGQCGSCWAFSTTGSLEGLHFLTKGSLLSFSEQQLVDCSGSYGNMGCNGGLMDYAFQYVEAKGIELESDYPYEGVDGQCRYDKSKVAFQNTGYHDVSTYSNSALESAVAKRPTSISVEADQSAFQLYHSGVVERGCGTSLDHGVLAVGYDTTVSQPYWLVKNSWGASWGENGYLKIAKGDQNGGAGECGILMGPTYPTD